ncbi:hypothetical protein C8R45DRAFT_1112769 [Mycena sanguinolenta]|nr:hypothetical protein C8R45DRAFT_1112769 [Mycena sanguinolenta]
MPIFSAPSRPFPTLQQCGTLFAGRRFSVGDKQIKLEDLYLVKNHPQREGIKKGRTFVYYQDTSQAGLFRTWLQEKDLETPMGTYEHITKLGYHELDEGDAVFSRSLQGDNDPLADVVQVWVADGSLWTPEMKKKLDVARDKILGPRNERDRARPTVTVASDGTSVKKGGTAFERSSIAKSVKEPARSYTIVPSLESPTSIMQPVASAKFKNGAIDSAVEDRSAALEGVTPFAMGTMLQGPKHVQDALKRRSSILNKASIGWANNWAFSTTQLNLALSRSESKAFQKGGSLSKDLGFFGGAHIDRGDAAGWYSNMTCNHDIPEYYDPEMFFILQIGAYRWVVISYPPRRTVNGTARVTLAALPNNEALIIPPEVLHTGAAKGWSPKPTTTRSSSIHEGATMMPRGSLVTFVVRWLVLLLFYVLQQLPAKFKVQMDPDLIIQAITYEADDGRRINVGPWEHAPGHRLTNQGVWKYEEPAGPRKNQDQVRSQAWVDWLEYERRVSQHVPYLGRKDFVETALSKPKKLTKTLQPVSEAEDADGEESTTDSEEDSEDEHVKVARSKRQRERMAKAVAERAAKARERKDKAQAKAATKATKSKSKKSKQAVPDPDEETDVGVSASDGDGGNNHAVVPDGKGPSSRAQRAVDRESRREEQLKMVSDSALGKRKQGPPLSTSETENESDGRRIRHEAEGGASSSLGPTTRSRSVKSVGGLSTAVVSEREEALGDVMVLRSRNSGSFLDTITLCTIEDNLHNVEYACLTVASAEPQRHSTDLALLRNVFKRVTETPNSVEIPSLLIGLWPRLVSMTEYEAEMSLTNRLMRHRIMVTHWRAWEWLDGYCSQQISLAASRSADQPVQEFWLHRLARDVRNVLENRTPSKRFDPVSYGLDLHPDVIYNHECRVPRFVLPEELNAQSVQLGVKIITSWLAFPLHNLARFQAWFINCICLAWGERALLLDEVWTAYTHLSGNVLGGLKGDTAIEALHTLFLAMNSHVLASHKSAEYRALKHIAGLLAEIKPDEFQDNTINSDMPDEDIDMPTASSSSAEVLSSQPAHRDMAIEMEDGSGLEEEEDEDGSGSEEGQDDVDPVDGSNNERPMAKTYLTMAKDRLLDEFYRFWREASEAPLVATPNRLQKEMRKHMDYLYPYREGAPSRQRVSGQDGPFTPARVRTDAGMLSALIFRGVTFGTEFLKEYAVFFDDIDHFHEVKNIAAASYTAKHGKPPPRTYFCLSNAYGPPNYRRTVERADDYAAALKNDSWAAKFQGNSKIRFQDCFDWLNGVLPNNQKAEGKGKGKEKKKKRFPVLGPLASYLLTADLVYAEAVEGPTADEMGSIVQLLNKGAVSGLEILRLIPPRPKLQKGYAKAKKEDCRRAFKQIFEKVEPEIPEDKQSQFNYMVLEHGLCKFSRSCGRKWFELH